MTAPPEVRGALEQALRSGLADGSVALLGLEPVGGGCISHAARLETSAGPFFAKWNADAPPRFFEREADCLRELARAEAGLVIPRVVWASDAREGAPPLIVMEYVPPGTGGDDEALGRGLATIHRLRAARFGFAGDTYCGTTRQDNARCDSWPEFYGRRRLGHLLALIERERGLPATDRRVYERLIERLPQLAGHTPEPSLVHGDLWSGNCLRTARGPALVDPSCAYADREYEFGITTLFGGLSARAWSAYEEAWPLAAGWRERNGLYQLYHLLNHHLLFGGAYAAQALSVARRYV